MKDGKYKLTLFSFSFEGRLLAYQDIDFVVYPEVKVKKLASPRTIGPHGLSKYNFSDDELLDLLKNLFGKDIDLFSRHMSKSVEESDLSEHEKVTARRLERQLREKKLDLSNWYETRKTYYWTMEPIGFKTRDMVALVRQAFLREL